MISIQSMNDQDAVAAEGEGGERGESSGTYICILRRYVERVRGFRVSTRYLAP